MYIMFAGSLHARDLVPLPGRVTCMMQCNRDDALAEGNTKSECQEFSSEPLQPILAVRKGSEARSQLVRVKQIEIFPFDA